MFRHDYPYTDFHELNLDWFLNRFNELLAEWDKMKGNFSDLETALADLKEYVMNFFDTPEFKQAVSDKLEEMAQDGTLDHLLNMHLTSGYINVVHAGAINDGINQTGAILNGIIEDYPNSTFYFPPGTYLIEETLNIFTDYNQRILLDGATIKANGAFTMLRIDKETSTTEETVETVSGQGVFDMNNVATIGISLSDSTRYVTIKDINIEHVGNGIGIKIGDMVSASLSSVIDNVKVRGTASTNLNSCGVDVYGFDCYINNTNIIRCCTGMRLRSGGNMLSGIHIWNDCQPTVEEWESGVGIDNNYIDNMFINIYLDNVKTGIRAIQPTLATNVFYYLPAATETAKEGHIFRAAQNSMVKVNGLYCVKKDNYTIYPFYISNRTQQYLVGANKSFICQGTNIYNVDGFQIVDECFNLKNNKYTGTLAKNLQSNTYAETLYLVGYISKTTGIGDLYLDYGGAFKYDIRINSERVRDLASSDITATLLGGNATGGTDKLIIGTPVTINRLTVYPVYINLTSGFNGYLGVDFESYGELNFYLNSHLNASECAVTEAISQLFAIDL